MTLAESLAKEYAEKLAQAGYPREQVIELLEQQGALWGEDLPGAQRAYQRVAALLRSLDKIR
jgi:hypothetical protein